MSCHGFSNKMDNNQTETLTAEVHDMTKSLDIIIEQDKINKISSTIEPPGVGESGNNGPGSESSSSENQSAPTDDDCIKERSPPKSAPAEDSVPSYLGFYDQQERSYLEHIAIHQTVAHEQLVNDRKQYSIGYYENSAKDDLILQYVANFRRQYTQLYIGRKELLLCPKNEFGIPVC